MFLYKPQTFLILLYIVKILYIIIYSKNVMHQGTSQVVFKDSSGISKGDICLFKKLGKQSQDGMHHTLLTIILVEDARIFNIL